MEETTIKFRDDLISCFSLKDRIPVTELAEKHLYLSSEYSKEAGYIRFQRYPYLKEPIDRLSVDDPCRVVVFKGPIQGGKTIIGQSFITSIIVQNPGPILYVTDTDTKAELFSRKRLEYMIRDDAKLTELVGEIKSRDGTNTIKFKKFPGGDIKLVGAQSVSGLTSDTCRFVVIDEADDHKENVSSAGDSISLAMGRQTTYGDMAKTLIVSSPKVKGESAIESWYDRGDRRQFFVPCPKCGEYQTLRFKDPNGGEYRLVWDKGDPSSARYRCAFCDHEFVNNDKNKILEVGKWEATYPEGGNNGVITSYGLNGLYLPVGSYSWEDMVRQWESAMDRLKVGDTEEHRTFVNTRLAEAYDPPADMVDPTSLQSHEEDYDEDKLPEEIRAITAGVDVQEDRIEVSVIGWGFGFESWLLGHYVLDTDPLDKTTWNALDLLRARKYNTIDGRVMKISAMCVDSGYRTQAVRDYCNAKKSSEHVRAIKGVAGKNMPIFDTKIRKGGKNKNLGRFYAVGVDTAKDAISSYLKLTKDGPGYCHFQKGTDPSYYQGLASEKRIKAKDKRGREYYVWVKHNTHTRNESLDCRVYSLAAVYMLLNSGFKFEKKQKKIEPEELNVDNSIVLEEDATLIESEELIIENESKIVEDDKPKIEPKKQINKDSWFKVSRQRSTARSGNWF